MQNYKELIVWQKAHQHVLLVYKYTKVFPKEEQFGLTNQLRRAAASIPSNIAEGAGKSTKKDFANYLPSAFGSSQEVEYLLLLSHELEYLTREDFEKINSLTNEIKAMLISLIKKVRA
ncbi:MAG: four helix bundle protein [Cyclobacteriaceae bacterium]|nr:four helix bundle protein [Cyclobacteriaceae bacterium]